MIPLRQKLWVLYNVGIGSIRSELEPRPITDEEKELARSIHQRAQFGPVISDEIMKANCGFEESGTTCGMRQIYGNFLIGGNCYAYLLER